jgi:hypothetical protein
MEQTGVSVTQRSRAQSVKQNTKGRKLRSDVYWQWVSNQNNLT